MTPMVNSGHMFDGFGQASTVSYTRREGPAWVIGLRGDVELDLLEEVEAATRQALSGSHGPLVFDLHEVGFCDSSLLNHLLLTNRGRKVALFGANAPLRRLLEVTGAASILPAYADLGAALTALSSLPPSSDRP
ncbi:STAS domain-containing protein [Streptomyces bauhiniae]|uniref:STAS domain-containing protein n=1 Tax=Streptomyces bauhiniae TaxID=2340725 RepID=UPI0035D7A5FA